MFAPDPDRLAAALPKVLWIELTSKCPFDCVFCTRRSRWGAGRHLDWALYGSLLAQLERPDFIGLNYSGESIYYPRLLEAIELAARTGAATEIVTAFSTIPPKLLRGLVESPLDRLAVSLHTMDPDQYQRLYRLGSLDLLTRRIDDFLDLRARTGRRTPRLDFCFVALEENLSELPAVAAYARRVGVREIFVHPIIGRHVTPALFPRELDGAALRDGFKADLLRALAAARHEVPEVVVTVLNASVEPSPPLGHVPRHFGPALPADARIHSCDQSPWETAHVLAGGDVVVCEVHDETSLGNLAERSLAEIWHGTGYRDFRRRYAAGAIPECRACPWKTAYVPALWQPAIRPDAAASAQLARGWYAADAGGPVWSRREALLVLPATTGPARLRVAGALPPAPPGSAGGNTLHVTCNGTTVGAINNSDLGLLAFDTTFPFAASAGHPVHVSFATDFVYRPRDAAATADTRDLGFALTEAAIEPATAGPRARAAWRRARARVRRMVARVTTRSARAR